MRKSSITRLKPFLFSVDTVQQQLQLKGIISGTGDGPRRLECVCAGRKPQIQPRRSYPVSLHPSHPRGWDLEILPTAQGWSAATSQAAGKAPLSSCNAMQTWQMLFLHLVPAILSKNLLKKTPKDNFFL